MPEFACTPLQDPRALQLFILVVSHERVTDSPLFTTVLFVEKERVGGGELEVFQAVATYKSRIF